jgi:putative FmdB family regulatory protein
MYEFECSSCKETIEKMLGTNAPPPKSCPACGTEDTLRKLISRSGFALKGDGWYSDHYGIKQGSKKSAPSTQESPAKSDSGSTPTSKSPAKSDAKPATASGSSKSHK